MMIYRKSTPEDCRAVYALICDLANKALPYDWFEAVYLDQLGDSHRYCLVCERAGAVIGVLNMRFEEQLHHGERIAELLEFSVAAEFRSMGVGKELLARGCAVAERGGCSQIEAACNRLRTDAHRFYLREGLQNSHYKFSKRLTGDENAPDR